MFFCPWKKKEKPTCVNTKIKFPLLNTWMVRNFLLESATTIYHSGSTFRNENVLFVSNMQFIFWSYLPWQVQYVSGVWFGLMGHCSLFLFIFFGEWVSSATIIFTCSYQRKRSVILTVGKFILKFCGCIGNATIKDLNSHFLWKKWVGWPYCTQ